SVEIPRVAVVETRDGEGSLLSRGDCYEMPDSTYHVGIDPAPIAKQVNINVSVGPLQFNGVDVDA
ncbi:hypothetical protein EXE43_24345, partial [Halorubrum sp. SS5]